MATIALMGLGAVIGGSIAGTGVIVAGALTTGALIGMTVGGLIGSYIDSNYIFAPDPISVDGPRLDDIVLQTASEGRGISEVYGRETRVGAQILYLSNIRETKTTESSGGGKGGGPSVSSTSYSYDVDIALGMCRGPIQTQASEVDAGVKKIFANGKLVYAADNGNLASGTFSCTCSMTYKYVSPGPYNIVQSIAITVTQAGAFADFDDGVTQVTVTGLTGVTSGAFATETLPMTKINDDSASFTKTITSAYGATQSLSTCPVCDYLVGIGLGSFSNPTDFAPRCFVSPAPATNNARSKYFAQTSGFPGAYTTASGPNFYNTTLTGGAAVNLDLTITRQATPFKAGIVSGATFYNGNQSTANALIAAAKEGGGAAPCWNGIAYIVFEKLQLADFGNSIPQFNMIVNKSGAVISGKDYGETVDDVISEIMTDAGYTASEFDVSGISNTRTKNGVYGYATSGAMTTTKKLQPLMVWHDIRVREEDGVLFFFDGDTPPTTTASASELGCREENEGVQQAFTISDTADFRLPSEVNTTYYDKNKDLQKGAEKVQKVNFEERNVRNYDSMVTSKSGKARQRAAQILYESEAFRRRAAFRLPPDRIDVREGDQIAVNTEANETFNVRAMKISRGANFVHEVEGIIEGARFELVDEDIGEDGEGGQDSTYTPPEMTPFLWTGEALSDDATITPTVVVGGSATQRDAEFLGATVFYSKDFGSTFINGGTLIAETPVFETTTILGDHFDPDVIDRKNTVDVKMFHGAPSSCTEIEMLNGQNRAVIGTELIGYTTVAQQSDVGGLPVYRLSGLLRNLRGQIGDGRMQSHTSSEPGAILANGTIESSVVPVELSFADTDLQIQYKVVPLGKTEAEVDSFATVLNGAKSIRTHCPGLIEFVRFTTAYNNTGGGSANLPSLNFQPNDLIIRFVRRGRRLQSLFGTNAMPNLTGKNVYTAEILTSATDSTVKRTLIHDSSGAEEGSTNHPLYGGKFQLVYTAAEQAADFGGAQSSVRIRLFQNGLLVERGNAADITG